MSEITIIILTFNSIRFIKACLDSVFAQDYQDFEVIVVDNGSKDDTIGFTRENYPQVILIENKENLGACKARNQGIEIAQGGWILTLDCDVILEKDFIKKIIEFAKALGDSVGMVQPKILNMDKQIIYSCGIYLSRLKRFYDIGKGQFDNGKFSAPKYIFGACSACALYKKDMLKEVKEDSGYFDERFFFLVEDVDLAWRAQRKGWRSLYYPEATCYHIGNSSNTSKKIRQYLCFRNRYISLMKNNGNKEYLLPLLIYEIPRIFYLLFTNRYTLRTLREIIRSIFKRNDLLKS